jgi:hypothetical protein
MIRLILGCLFAVIAPLAHAINVNLPCPTTPGAIVSGSLSAAATQTRTSCTSPCAVWFDATGTTDSAHISPNMTVFQNLQVLWDYGDTLPSGQQTWAFGSRPNVNSKSKGTGLIGAHMYQTVGRTTAYNITATIYDGANQIKCGMGLSVIDPSVTWSGTNTTCIAATTTPVAGVGGCPAGASVLQSSSLVIGNMSGIRKLYKCGDTFSNTSVTVSGNASPGDIGAYGGCENTQTNRPIFLAAGAGTQGWFTLTNPSKDIRVHDIVFDGNNIVCSGTAFTSASCTLIDNQTGGTINGGNKIFQYTFYNIATRNYWANMHIAAAGQLAVVGSTFEAVPQNPGGCSGGICSIGTYFQSAGIGSWTTSGVSEDYGFVAGNSFDNGAGNNTFETVRMNYASKYIMSNNTSKNAGLSWAVWKMEAQDFATDGGTFDGTFSQNNIFSDNFMGGTAGANLTEFSPQNTTSDERLRWIVIERNVFNSLNANGRQILASGANFSIRDNVFIITPSTTSNNNVGVQVAQRGIEPVPTFFEVFNNTCSSTGLGIGTGVNICVRFTNAGQLTPAGPSVSNSLAENNLAFNDNTVIDNTGGTNSGTNTIANNTVTSTNNPGFTNGSGTLSFISDFKPTANFTLTNTPVPVYSDGVLISWQPVWDLGAVRH